MRLRATLKTPSTGSLARPAGPQPSRSRRAGESGQITPILLLIMLSVVALTSLLFVVARATDLKGQSQTAADAAALAGELSVKQQIIALQSATGEGITPASIDWARVDAAAAQWASSNDGRILSSDHQGFDYRVIVESTSDLSGKEAGRIGVQGKHLITRARATIVSVIPLNTPGGGFIGSGGGATGGDNHISAAELKQIEQKAGVKLRPDSALRVYGGNGSTGSTDVKDLTMAMKVAIARAESLLGHAIPIVSGFRSYAGQVAACGQNSACAAPGTSLHEFGMAIDVGNPGELAALLSSPRGRGVGICHPAFTLTDPREYTHFSISPGRECGGGSAGGGVPSSAGAAGGLPGTVGYNVHLVPYEGPPQLSLPGFSGAAMPATLSQTQIAAMIGAVGKQLGVSCTVMLSAFETGLVESNFTNIPVKLDHTSLGVFQQQDWWGSAASRLNVADSATRYFLRAIAEARNHPGESAGDIAANVQQPAAQYRYRYAASEALARQYMQRVGVNCP